jgi:fumarate hydratase subunit beta
MRIDIYKEFYKGGVTMTKKISAPLTEEQARSLKVGDEVFLSGSILTGRDVAHKRLCYALDNGEKLPVSLEGQIIYFVGPSPAKPGNPIGSAGPTTSYRMDPYSPILMKQAGLRGMIGKGPRSERVVNIMKEKGCVYFAAIGGAAALIAKTIKKAEVVCYPELGPEAIRKLTVENFPVIVAQDSEGNSLFEEGPKKYKRLYPKNRN